MTFSTVPKWVYWLAIPLVAFCAYCIVQRRNDTPRIFYRAKLINNYNGYIIPPFGVFIKSSEKENTALIEHEMMHWKQFQREGLLRFLFNYGKHAVKDGYDKNPYEVEARTVEDDYCKHNYTECIRSGKSKTAYNPNFRK